MKYKWVIISSFALLFLFLLTMTVACNNKEQKAAENKAIDSLALKNRELIYSCPMHHQIQEHAPGKCPICGMTLVAVERTQNNNLTAKLGAKSDNDTLAILTISPREQLLAGIHIDTARETSLPEELTLTGTTIFDPTQQEVISARVNGWIKQMYVRNPGEKISAGQKLYDVYSPDLLSTQKDYLLALRQKDLFKEASVDFTAAIQAMRQKLLRWGLSPTQIDELQKESPTPSGSVTIYSNTSGYLVQKMKEEGNAIKEGDVIFSLANNNTLWVQAELYDQELSFLSRFLSRFLSGDSKKETTTLISVDLAGGSQGLPGKIVFDNPVNVQDSRVHLVNIAIPNPNGQIQPGMLAYVHLQTEDLSGKRAVVVPKSAIIYAQKSNYVWIALPNNSFERRLVQLGDDNQSMTSVLQGINPRERVVSSGAFLLNSEYTLKHGSGVNLSGMQMSDMQMSGKVK